MGRRARRRRALAVAGALGASAAAVAVLPAAAGSRAGPLATEDDPRVESGVGVHSLRLGEGFCYGMVVVHNPSRRPVTLTGVRVHGGAGLSVGPAHVLGPERAETQATADRCPLDAAALLGFVVPPAGADREDDLRVQVLLPVRIDRPGKSRIVAVTVTYQLGSRSYAVEDTGDVVACTYDCEARPGGR